MKKYLKNTIKILSSLFLIFLVLNSYSQDINYKTKEKASIKISENIVNNLINKELEESQLIIILPVYNSNGEITSISDELTNKIVHNLNLSFKNQNLKFSAKSYKDDKILFEEIKKTHIEPENSLEFYEGLLGKFTGDYLISANYNYNEKNFNFIIENTEIHENYYEEKVKKYDPIPVENVVVPDIPIVKIVLRSAIVPGWGQMYKNKNQKGYYL